MPCCCGQDRDDCGWSSRSIFSGDGQRKKLEPSEEAYRLRRIVGDWLRIRMKHIDESIGLNLHINGAMLSKSDQKLILQQLAADADHSFLLPRLLDGQEPLDFDVWKRMIK